MSLIVDGYNFLNATDLGAPGRTAGTLAAARLAVLNFVAESVPADQLPRTTVVFDAGQGAPRGRARVHKYRGLTVRFASEYKDADELIEQLIEADSAPRRLTVVSSDHRLQRAARRRCANPIDSDRWYSQVSQQRRRREQQRVHSAKPPPPATAAEVEYWMRLFDETAHQKDATRPEN
jgi:predicted RNA-binding protein with PIN domain